MWSKKTANGGSSLSQYRAKLFNYLFGRSLDGVLGIGAFKLSEDDVKMLGNMKATGLYANKQLSHIFNINERNVRRIYSRETYKEIE